MGTYIFQESLHSHTRKCVDRGAFKFRGACNAVQALSEEQRRCGVVTHSSGNHALSLALAAQLAGIPAYIVVPSNTPQVLGLCGAAAHPCMVREFDVDCAMLMNGQRTVHSSQSISTIFRRALLH